MKQVLQLAVSLLSSAYLLPATAEAPTKVHETTTKHTVGLIDIGACGAVVTIGRSDKDHDIKVTSNFPAHWKLSKSSMFQLASTVQKNGFLVQISEDHKGYVIQDSTGYELPRDKIGFCMHLPNDPQHKLKLVDNTLIIGDEKIIPLSVKANYVQPAEDRLEVTIPNSYSGDLLLRGITGSVFKLASWNKGNLRIDLKIGSMFQGGELRNLSKVQIDLLGGSRAVIKRVSCDDLNLTSTQDSFIQIESASAHFTKATANRGTMSLHGNFGGMIKNEYNGKIEVTQ